MERREPYPLGQGDRFRVFREGTYRAEDLELKRLEDLPHWHVAEGEPDVRGWGIYTRDGDRVGQVQTLIASPKTREVYFLVAQIGGVLGVGGEHVLTPLDMIHLDRENQRVEVNATRDDLDGAVEWRSGESIDYVAAYRYWESRAGAVAGGRMAGVAGGEAPEVRKEGEVDIETKGDVDVE